MEKKGDKFHLPVELVIGNVAALFKEFKSRDRAAALVMDFGEVEKFDSAGIAFLNYVKKHFSSVAFENVRPEFSQVFEKYLSGEKVAPREEPVTVVAERIEKLGDRFWRFKNRARIYLSLLADEIYYTFQYLVKRRGVYPGEILHQLYFMAYDSAPIVCFISFLVGVTISVTSAQQLKLLGADIYIADLVGFGMIRELVPLMTGIILAGKIGAAITAEISSMKVMEEVDALKTMGLQPEQFLMVPRLIAITLAIPLLVALADFVGIFAGMLVARFFLGIVARVFLDEMFLIVGLGDVLIGLGKTIAFGWVVVVSAGYKGFSVERGAREVGVATTRSVVLSISLIIVLDCIFAILLY
jgi:phospholipid/cholesterol/gamma-HCH transport system permease protein